MSIVFGQLNTDDERSVWVDYILEIYTRLQNKYGPVVASSEIGTQIRDLVPKIGTLLHSEYIVPMPCLQVHGRMLD